jgi:O-antigen ligase
LLVLAPLPFGAVTIGWATLLWSGCFVALLVALRTDDWPADGKPTRRAAGALAAIAVFGLLQSVPLPGGLVGLLSPKSAAQAQASRDLLSDEGGGMATISLAPGASRRSAVGWLAAAAALLAAAICATHRRHRWVLFAAVIATAFLEVFFGAQRLFAGATEIWGIEVPGDPGRLRGTFINSDHLALYLLVALAVCFGWVYRSVRRAARERQRERRVVMVAVPIVCWLALFVGLAFTGSRAGLLAGLVATGAQGFLLAASVRHWRYAPVGLLAGLLAIATVAWVGLEQGFGRLLATSAYEAAWSARPLIYKASLSLWSMFPIFGTGLGSFQEAFTLVLPAEVSGLVWGHAHNDWLEVLLTTGLIGAAIVGFGVWMTASALWKILIRSRSSSSRAFALGALGAAIGVGLHSLLDFGLTMPANAFTLAVVIGAALGAARRYPKET